MIEKYFLVFFFFKMKVDREVLIEWTWNLDNWNEWEQS